MRVLKLDCRLDFRTLIGISGLVALVLAIPLNSYAQSAKKKHSIQAKKASAIVKHAQGQAATSADPQRSQPPWTS